MRHDDISQVIEIEEVLLIKQILSLFPEGFLVAEVMDTTILNELRGYSI